LQVEQGLEEQMRRLGVRLGVSQDKAYYTTHVAAVT
jgi:hypothetical protein